MPTSEDMDEIDLLGSKVPNKSVILKGSADPSFFIFELDVGKKTDPTYKDCEFESSFEFESISKFIIQFLSRCKSDPSLFDIDFKHKMASIWTTHKNF